MTKSIFMPAKILLPKDVSMEKWSVIACDQFSSEHDYWERVADFVGDAPSTLKMVIPEAFLEDVDEASAISSISAAMNDYINCGVFHEVADSFIYVERTQPDGRVRRGVIGTVDLEEYDFACANAEIIASEGTVLDRLPPRIRVRRNAKLELPHIITFVDDIDDLLIGPLAKKAGSLPVLYDFSLMEGGGRIKGMQVTSADAENVMKAIAKLRLKNNMLMVVGDGNHSLAAAKLLWNEIKETLTEEERESHPARVALVEVNNVYDSAIDFEAIHRIIFDVVPDEFLFAFEKAMMPGNDYVLHWVAQDKSGEIGIAADCIGDMLVAMQDFIDDYASKRGCRIDYIHGEDSTKMLAKSENCVGIVLPAMEKAELFATVAASGVFPKKSFSVGHARDKRYYLECRLIASRS